MVQLSVIRLLLGEGLEMAKAEQCDLGHISVGTGGL